MQQGHPKVVYPLAVKQVLNICIFYKQIRCFCEVNYLTCDINCSSSDSVSCSSQAILSRILPVKINTRCLDVSDSSVILLEGSRIRCC